MSNMYAAIRRTFANDPEAGKRCADRLIKLRAALADLRARRSDQTILLATWNIRDFDSNKFGFGPRMPESFYYIAEIMSSFDLIAVQEVNRDLSALERVMSILGGDWDYIATDTTEGPGGNGERMAFVFNRDRVFFRKIAGEIVLPDGQLIVSPATVDASKPGEDPPPRSTHRHRPSTSSNSRAARSWSRSSRAGSAFRYVPRTSITARRKARSSNAASPRSRAW